MAALAVLQSLMKLAGFTCGQFGPAGQGRRSSCYKVRALPAAASLLSTVEKVRRGENKTMASCLLTRSFVRSDVYGYDAPA